jgi:hypothetical protein
MQARRTVGRCRQTLMFCCLKDVVPRLRVSDRGLRSSQGSI